MNANVDYIIKTAIGEFNYLDYEGQHITATNSIEGHAKSAILKGQTLVNLFKYSSSTDGFGGYFDKTTSATKYMTFNNRIVKYHLPANTNMSAGSSSPFRISANDERFVVGKEYSLVFRVLTLENAKSVAVLDTSYIDFTDYIKVDFIFDGTDVSMIRFSRRPVDSTLDMTIEVEMLYLGEKLPEDMDLDIPYFEGMQSVKMPVLTTTGKNLFDINGDINQKYSNMLASPNPNLVNGTTIIASSNTSHHHGKGQKIKVERGEVYTCSFSSTNGGVIEIHTPLKLNYVVNKASTFTFTVPTDCDEIIISFITKGGEANGEIHNFQLEKGTQATTYEPYKSNILTVNEEVELRGIGDVKDELDCLTGELTERIVEIVLDGVNYKTTKSVNNTDGTKRFDTNFTFEKFVGTNDWVGATTMNSSVICDKVICVDGQSAQSTHPNRNAIAIYNGTPVLFFEDKTILTVEKANEWLKQNPITVQYQLKTPTIKTVDLSDNHVYSYKGTTHYDCSSAEGSLVPTLSVKVPTDTQLTIQEQKATTQTLLIKNMDLQQSIKEVQAMNLAFNTALYNSFNSIREEVEDIKKHVSTNENLEGSF